MQHQLPVSETAIRDTMAAVFRQAAFVRRQPSWIARQVMRFLEWLGDLLRQFSGSRTTSPLVFWTVVTVLVVIALAIAARLSWVSYRRRRQGRQDRLHSLTKQRSVLLRPAPALNQSKYSMLIVRGTTLTWQLRCVVSDHPAWLFARLRTRAMRL